MHVERLAIKPYRTEDPPFDNDGFLIIVLDKEGERADNIGTAHYAKGQGWVTWAFMHGEDAEGPPIFKDVEAKSLLKLLKKVARQLNEEDY